MMSLEASQASRNPRYVCSGEARFDRLYPIQHHAAKAAGYRDLSLLARVAAENGARRARGHLDDLTVDVAPALVSEPVRWRDAAMIDERKAMNARMAREKTSAIARIAEIPREHPRRTTRVVRH